MLFQSQWEGPIVRGDNDLGPRSVPIALSIVLSLGCMPWLYTCMWVPSAALPYTTASGAEVIHNLPNPMARHPDQEIGLPLPPHGINPYRDCGPPVL